MPAIGTGAPRDAVGRLAEGGLVAPQLGLLHVRRDPLDFGHAVAGAEGEGQPGLIRQSPAQRVLVPREATWWADWGQKFVESSQEATME